MLKEKTFQDQWIIFVTIPIINTAYQAKKVFKMSYFWILLLNWRDPCYEWALLWFMCNVKICALCKILARSYRRREAEKKKEGTRAKLTSLSPYVMNERLHYWGHFFILQWVKTNGWQKEISLEGLKWLGRAKSSSWKES